MSGKYSKHAQFRNRLALPRHMNWGVMTLPVRQHEGIFDIRDTTSYKPIIAFYKCDMF